MRAEVGRLRVLSPKLHRILDFVVVAVFVIAPLAVGLGGLSAVISEVLAVVHLMMTLATRFPGGAARLISLFLHGMVELAEAVFLVALPYLAGFGPGSPAKRFFVTMAALIFLVWLLTDYRGTESSPI